MHHINPLSRPRNDNIQTAFASRYVERAKAIGHSTGLDSGAIANAYYHMVALITLDIL